MLYFSRLPDHKSPGFNEQAHFNSFREHNIVFNATATKSRCDYHVGCLSLKTVTSGEEVYEFNGLRKIVRPGRFLILNHDQSYSSSITSSEAVKSISIFFTEKFASSVFSDTAQTDAISLDNPRSGTRIPEFFQTLYEVDNNFQQMLTSLTEKREELPNPDEALVFLLQDLLKVHSSEIIRSNQVHALKLATRTEIYKRLCIAKDVLHSAFTTDVDLTMVSSTACLSVPQLIRQFKAVYHVTPYQYLVQIRLNHASELLKGSMMPVQEIALASGFENTSAFCRAFKSAYGITPMGFRLAA
jgi:AraC family transcriptional regulator